MMQRFKNIRVLDNGSFAGIETRKNLTRHLKSVTVIDVAEGTERVVPLKDEGPYIEMRFSAIFPLWLINEAWGKGVDFEDLADGFGKGLGTMGGDWSGIRDSSLEAVSAMFERALNHFFPLE